MSLREKVKSRGFMDVTIRPAQFERQRVKNITRLPELVRELSVRVRGWDFPHLAHETPGIFEDYVELGTEFQHVKEVWRLYQSGLFNHVSGLNDDWRDESTFWPPDQGWSAGTRLGVESMVGRLAEIFLFAGRLALSDAGDARMHVAIKLVKLAGRGLYFGEQWRAFFGFSSPRVASAAEYPVGGEFSREDLVATPMTFADRFATEIFRRFGWDADPRALDQIRRELGFSDA